MLFTSPTRVIILLAIVLLVYLQLGRFLATSSPPTLDIDASPDLVDSIPKKIWQTAPKCPTLPARQGSDTAPEKSSQKGDEKVERIQSWLEKNPEWDYECLDDEGAETWVRKHFEKQDVGGNETSIDSGTAGHEQKALKAKEDVKWVAQLFLDLKDRILKADILRYLLLYIEGGLYTDLDTTCHFSISAWTTNSSISSSAQVIVGIESDRQPVENDWKLYSDYRKYIWGITNWTFASRPGHPFLRAVLLKVGNNLRRLAEKQGKKELGELRVLYKDVIETTGPRAFSEAFLEYMKAAVPATIKGHESFSMLEEAKLVEGTGVLVLPIRAFSLLEADRVDGEGARSLGVENVVRHWSEGGWKGDHLIDDRKDKERPEGWKEVARKEGIDETL